MAAAVRTVLRASPFKRTAKVPATPATDQELLSSLTYEQRTREAAEAAVSTNVYQKLLLHHYMPEENLAVARGFASSQEHRALCENQAEMVRVFAMFREGLCPGSSQAYPLIPSCSLDEPVEKVAFRLFPPSNLIRVIGPYSEAAPDGTHTITRRTLHYVAAALDAYEAFCLAQTPPIEPPNLYFFEYDPSTSVFVKIGEMVREGNNPPVVAAGRVSTVPVAPAPPPPLPPVDLGALTEEEFDDYMRFAAALKSPNLFSSASLSKFPANSILIFNAFDRCPLSSVVAAPRRTIVIEENWYTVGYNEAERNKPGAHKYLHDDWSVL